MGHDKAAERKARLADALRQNLRRRKDARAADVAAPETDKADS